MDWNKTDNDEADVQFISESRSWSDSWWQNCCRQMNIKELEQWNCGEGDEQDLIVLKLPLYISMMMS